LKVLSTLFNRSNNTETQQKDIVRAVGRNVATAATEHKIGIQKVPILTLVKQLPVKYEFYEQQVLRTSFDTDRLTHNEWKRW
jgi:hypothetical protein